MERLRIPIPSKAAADLRAMQGRVVTFGGVLASTPYTVGGILSPDTRPNSGDPATITVFGRERAIAGAAVAAGAALQVTSGGFVTTAASGDHVFGRAETAASSGGVVHGVFNFLNLFMSTSAAV